MARAAFRLAPERKIGPVLRVLDGHFVDAEASHAILFLTTRHSAFDAEHQAPFADFIERSFGALDADFGGVLSLERSAVHRFAAASEQLAREVGMDPTIYEYDEDGIRAAFGVDDTTESMTYRQLQERRQLIRSRLRTRA